MRWSGSYAELAPILDATEALALARGDRPRLAGVLATRVHMLNITGRIEAAIALAERARAEAAEAADAGLLVTASRPASPLSTPAASPTPNPSSPTRCAATTSPRTCASTATAPAPWPAPWPATSRAPATSPPPPPRPPGSARPYDRIFADAAAAYVAHERRDATTTASLFRRTLARSEEAGIVQLRPRPRRPRPRPPR